MTLSFELAKTVPGPRGVPIFGNALQLPLNSELPKTCENLAKQYGDVFQIRIGSTDVVVLNGRNAIRQALVRQPIDFAGRPDLLSLRTYGEIFGPNISFGTHSPGWKLHRKLGERALRHFTSGKQTCLLEEKVLFEINELIGHWTNNNKEKVTVDSLDVLKLSLGNVLLSLIIGRRHELDNPKLLDFVSLSDDFGAVANSGNPADFFPWMSYFTKGLMTKYINVLTSFKSWFGDYITEHVVNYRSGSEDDILDYLLTISENMDGDELEVAGLTREILQSSVYDFFGAGMDTTSGALSWAILYMIMFPGCQERMRKEIDEVMKRERTPKLSDRKQLPYTEAFIYETLRFSSVVPFTVPHSTTKDTVLQGKYGYKIPKDTVVFVNLHSVQHDGSQWENPGKFDPTRFLNDSGDSIDNVQVEKMMPFGAGRRRCMGSEIAKKEIFLYVSHLVYRCHFEAEEESKLTLDCEFRLSLRPRPFKMKISPR